MYDVLIRGGAVVDGTGAARRQADVGISGGRVVSIGRIEGPAKQVLEAEGRVVAPGFVDVHTHYDAQAFWDTTLSPSPLHGVTTVVGGNCGFTVAPVTGAGTEYVMRMLAKVEGMPLESLRQGLPWNWRTTGEYLDRLDGTLAVNAGFLVGHSTLRRYVLGEEAVTRTSTPEELEGMARILQEALQAGALGFSSTWASTHNDASGKPVPSRHADASELLALARVCGEVDGTSLEFIPTHGPFDREVAELLVGMSLAAQRPLNWNIMIVTAATLSAWLDKLEVSSEARRRGAKVVGLVAADIPDARLNFASGNVLDALPGWAGAMALPLDDKLALLSNPERRRHLHARSLEDSPMRHFAAWDAMVVVETFSPATAPYTGRSVGEIADVEGKQPFDALCDIACADHLRTVFTSPRGAMTAEDWKARASIWRDDRTVVGASDAGAHLDQISMFTFATSLLEKGVREQRVLSLEEAVRLLSDEPARLYGLRDRGRLVEGAWADVVVFDEDTVGPEAVYTRHDLPGGAGRLYAGAYGIDSVLVNGIEIVDHGEMTDARPGTLLRSGRDTVTPALT